VTLPYWLRESLSALPLVAWVYFALGVPWALALLPRADWPRRVLVLALAFALGPALLTAWMFVLGSFDAPLLQFPLVFGGSVVLLLLGVLLAWAKYQRTPNTKVRKSSTPASASVSVGEGHDPGGRNMFRPYTGTLAIDERLLLGLIVIAVLLRWLVVAYWPFIGYDALWVYGYNGRLFTLAQTIPDSIGYYPQFLPLQYTFIQLGVGGLADHAARMVVPMLHIGAILAAYVLAQTLFTSRRVAIIAAGIWALYPHVGDWARYGDLEIPLAFLFTLSAAFFLRAWLGPARNSRRWYALMAGVLFGVAMWTKPTAGGFVWGVVLLVLVEFVRVRGDWRAWWPRFEVAAITGLACIPLGAAWYVRNIAFGHPPLVFPHENWLLLARRSGDLLGWPLLLLALVMLWLLFARGPKPDWRGVVMGSALIAAGALPSMPWLDPTRFDPPASYILWHEALLLLLGGLILAWALWRYLRSGVDNSTRDAIGRSLWAYLLALPYFATWFYSYSYHPRLSLAVVPLLIAPIAALLAQIITQARLVSWLVPVRVGYLLLIAALSLPGVLIVYTNSAREAGWLFSAAYPDDDARYREHAPDMLLLRDALAGYAVTHDRRPVVLAPGNDRLRFFLLDDTVKDVTCSGTTQRCIGWADIDPRALPTQLEALEAANATHYLYGNQAEWRYENAGIAPGQNQVVSALARDRIISPAVYFSDGVLRYELYELALDERFERPGGLQLDDTIVFGDAIQLHNVSPSNQQLAYTKVFTWFTWEVLQELDTDYKLFVHLINRADGELYYNWDAFVMPSQHGYYGTHLWDAGEFVLDKRMFILDDPDVLADIPQGNEQYEIRIGFYHPQTWQRLPLTINGQAAGDSYTLPLYFHVIG
jgi:4-amino-4-deoxy-L-arabinose transferase-like glycosyltransferase